MRLCIVATRNITSAILFVHCSYCSLNFYESYSKSSDKILLAKVVFEIIDSNNSTNIAEINNSFVVIDSHLSTRVSKKRARMLFHYRTLMRGKKNTLRRIFVKGGKKKKHNPTAFFTSRSLNDSFFASFHSVFFLPPQPCYFNTQCSSTCFSTPF